MFLKPFFICVLSSRSDVAHVAECHVCMSVLAWFDLFIISIVHIAECHVCLLLIDWLACRRIQDLPGSDSPGVPFMLGESLAPLERRL